MTEEISRLLDKARDLASGGQKELAMKLANDLVKNYPESHRVWRFRAMLHSVKSDFAAAIQDSSIAISLFPMSTTYLTRGEHYYSAGHYEEALLDLNIAIEKDTHEDETYTHHVKYRRGLTLLKLGKKREAALDILSIPASSAPWMDGDPTREKLLKELED
jgi:tetratricopeptide (TPR) repeat protein